MNRLSIALLGTCFSLAAGTAAAQDATKKPDTMPQTGMTTMTLQQCKDHMAMMKKDEMNKDAPKKDEAAMKQHAMCADMMKKDGMTGEPAKK